MGWVALRGLKTTSALSEVVLRGLNKGASGLPSRLEGTRHEAASRGGGLEGPHGRFGGGGGIGGGNGGGNGGGRGSGIGSGSGRGSGRGSGFSSRSGSSSCKLRPCGLNSLSPRSLPSRLLRVAIRLKSKNKATLLSPMRRWMRAIASAPRTLIADSMGFACPIAPARSPDNPGRDRSVAKYKNKNTKLPRRHSLPALLGYIIW